MSKRALEASVDLIMLAVVLAAVWLTVSWVTALALCSVAAWADWKDDRLRAN